VNHRFKYDPAHPVFHRPPASTRLWRYLDFTKFVALLEDRSLFLAPADRFEDRFEGSVSAATVELRERLRLLADSADPQQRQVQLKNIEKTLDDAARYRREQAAFTYISCWHASDDESAGMWAQYTPTGHGVAVQTTLDRLEAVMPTEGPAEGSTLLYVGLVTYIDYRTGVVPEANSFAPYIHKRMSFAHEHELRIVSQLFPYTDDFDDDGRRLMSNPEPGLAVPIDLDRLIANIYLRPNTPSWVRRLVETQARRAGVLAPIIVSDLDRDPVF
jgi:hypothetical protein